MKKKLFFVLAIVATLLVTSIAVSAEDIDDSEYECLLDDSEMSASKKTGPKEEEEGGLYCCKNSNQRPCKDSKGCKN